MNNKILLRILALLPVAVVSVSLAWAQKSAEQQPVKPVDYAEGRALYMKHCASCHGVDGKGGGAVAVSMKVAPTDLTLLKKKNNGEFPKFHVMAFIDGEKVVPAHGTREMPVWGRIFRRAKGDSAATMKVYALSKYIESIQP